MNICDEKSPPAKSPKPLAFVVKNILHQIKHD
jgi:hypothetical protein